MTFGEPRLRYCVALYFSLLENVICGHRCGAVFLVPDLRVDPAFLSKDVQ